MTCTIEGLDAGKHVDVSWKDPDGTAVADDDSYDLVRGDVTDGKQEAVLTIKASKMDSFKDSDKFTYKCLVKSSQYANMVYPAAGKDVVADVLNLALGECMLHVL